MLKLLSVLFVTFGMVLIPPPSLAAPHATSLPQATPSASPLSIQSFASADFSLTVNPTSLTMSPGTSQTVQVTATSQSGFAGPIYLEAFGFPLIASLSSSSLILTSPGSVSTVLTVKAPAGMGQESDHVQVGATGGCALIHYADIPVTVNGPDFSITPEKTKLTVSQTASDTTTLDISSINGFAGTITLSTPFSFEFAISPASVSLTLGQTTTQVLTVQEGLFPPDPGNYNVTVDADSQGLSHHFDLNVTVSGSTFTLSSEKTTMTVLEGGSNSTIIDVTPVETYSGTILLTNMSYPQGLSLSLSTTTANLPPLAKSTLTVTAEANATVGIYYVIVSGTDGTTPKSVFIPVTVKASDFTVEANPGFLILIAGGSVCSTSIQVTGLNGFSGTASINEEHDLGLTVTFPGSTSFQIPGSTTLNVKADSGTSPGFHSIDVNATVGTAIHGTTIDLFVIGPDFEITTNPSSLIVVAGQSNSTEIDLKAQNQFGGTVSLQAITFDPGIHATVSPSTITNGATSILSVSVDPGTAAGSFYYVEVNATSGNLNHPIYVQITVEGPDFSLSASAQSISFNAGSTSTTTIILKPIRGFSDSVSFFATSSPDLNATVLPATVTSTGSSTSSTTLYVNSTIPGQYSVDVIAVSTSGINHDILIPVTVYAPDFSIAATTPSTVPADGIATATTTISVNSFHGFTGTVDLTYDALPSGVSCPNFDPATVQGSGTATLACTSIKDGTFTVTITGTSGSLHHSTTATFTFSEPDFQISATNPSPVLADGTTSATSTITVTFTNGLMNTVELTATSSSDATCGTPSPHTLSSSGTATVSCTSSKTGTYPVTITGTTGSITHTTTATFVFSPIPGFSLAPDHSTLSIQQGSTGTGTITVSPTGSFSGTVALSYTVSPSGPTVSFSNPSIIGGSGTSAATINIPNGLNTGTYTVTVTGTSGSQTHSTTIAVTVTAAQSAAPAPGSNTVLYSIIGVVVAAIAIGGGMLYLRSRKPAKLAKTP